MEQDWCKASAAGSLMLMGEYAVLHGKPALALAIDKRITVFLKSRSDHQLVIQSALGEYICPLNELGECSSQAPFEFVLATLNRYRSELMQGSGLTLTITSQFSDKVGFGSSAAIVVASLQALGSFFRKTWTKETLFQAAKEIVQQVQGGGSGTDVAASVYGGVVFYQPLLSQVEKLDILPPLVLLYAGYKTPTPQAIRQVKAQYEKQAALFDKLFDILESCTLQARLAITQQDWIRFGELMNIHQGIQAALGVSDATLEHLIYRLRSCSGIVGAKISGAGLGDCVIGLGALTSSYIETDFQADKSRLFSVQGSLQGVLDE